MLEAVTKVKVRLRNFTWDRAERLALAGMLDRLLQREKRFQQCDFAG
jgi:hypothetical protein